MTSRATLIVVGLAIAVTIAYQLTPAVARLDDAYISLHSARVVLSGHDPIFNVPALVGVTSPAYVALLVAILAPGVVAGDTALRLANALGVVAFTAAVWHLGSVITLSIGRRLALVTIVLASGWVVVNLTNGLETGWAMAVLTFAIANAYAGRLMPVACAAGLLPFLRPDLAPASILLLWYVARRRTSRQQLVAVVAALGVAVPWLIWIRFNTGDWLPQTMRAKTLFFAESCWPWATKASTVAAALVLVGAQLFPLVLGLPDLARDWLGRAGLLSIVATVGAYFVVFPGALPDHFLRYPYAFVVPWLCLGFARGLRRFPIAVALTAAGAVVVAQFAVNRVAASGFSFDEMKSSADWIDAYVPADAVVLVHDAGGYSEFAHRRAIDLVGLKTPSSSAAHAQWTWPTCGVARSRAIGAIVRSSGASFLVARRGWDDPLRHDLEAEGFVLVAARPTKDETRGYTVFHLDARPHAAGM